MVVGACQLTKMYLKIDTKIFIFILKKKIRVKCVYTYSTLRENYNLVLQIAGRLQVAPRTTNV